MVAFEFEADGAAASAEGCEAVEDRASGVFPVALGVAGSGFALAAGAALEFDESAAEFCGAAAFCAGICCAAGASVLASDGELLCDAEPAMKDFACA